MGQTIHNTTMQRTMETLARDVQLKYMLDCRIDFYLPTLHKRDILQRLYQNMLDGRCNALFMLDEENKRDRAILQHFKVAKTNTVPQMIRRRVHRRRQPPIKAKKEVVKRVTKSDRKALIRKMNHVERVIMDESMKPHSKNRMSALDEVRALFHSKYG